MCHTYVGIQSWNSFAEIVISWCSVPNLWAANLAYGRSSTTPKSENPTVKLDSRRGAILLAMLSSAVESNPPLNRKPTGTSLIMCSFTVLSSKSASRDSIASELDEEGSKLKSQYCLISTLLLRTHMYEPGGSLKMFLNIVSLPAR